jgi:hypothetical protein
MIDTAITVGRVLLEAFGPQIQAVFDSVAGGAGFLADNIGLLETPIQGVIAAFTVLLALKVAAFFLATGLALVTSFSKVTLAVTAIGLLAGVLLDLSGLTLPEVIRGVAEFVDGVIGFFIGLKDAAIAVFSNFGTLLAGTFQTAFALVGELVERFLNVLIEQFNTVGDIVGLAIDPVNILELRKLLTAQS